VYQEFRAFGFYLVSISLQRVYIEELNEAMVVLDGQENLDNQIFGLVCRTRPNVSHRL
jgi:hypothetical protein